MASKIGVALVGSGIFVQEEHLPAVQACPDLELKAIYSRSFKSAQALGQKLSEAVPLFSDDGESSEGNYAALLECPDVQAVIIALPIPAQPPYIRAALRAGKHVLAEKPVAPTVADAEALLAFYRSEIDGSKVNLSIAEQMRFLPDTAAGVKRARELGPVTGCRVVAHSCIRTDFKYLATEWRKTPAHQGGFLLDGGVHTVATLRALLGKQARVKRVVAQTALLKDYLPPKDTIEAVLLLENGATGSLSMSFGTASRAKENVVVCEKGVVKVTRDTVTLTDEAGKETKEEAKDALGGVALEVYAWAKSLKEGKWDPRQSAEEALGDLEILEACLKSGEQGGMPVDLKHQV